jgi:hypothetical protein
MSSAVRCKDSVSIVRCPDTPGMAARRDPHDHFTYFLRSPPGLPGPPQMAGDRSFGSRFIEHMRDAFEALAQARSMAEAGAR